MESKGLRNEPQLQASGSGVRPEEVARHSLMLMNREQIAVQGVLAVDSFNDGHIVLETVMGTMTLRGEGLHIKQLDLESGRFGAEGYFNSCTYAARREPRGRGARGRSLLERLLK
ncbi:MAG: sporulation protein YabP [Mycobacterium leprae]